MIMTIKICKIGLSLWEKVLNKFSEKLENYLYKFQQNSDFLEVTLDLW